ncbi:MAG TPA: HPr family phosphocarrier protein [Candidatus Sabulitectum sp.]|nr:HPr family phosphocarrier protein [Candidatus Sabulitectum sp.]HPF32099.1 HPr family phosphocarrier protein [Candidatus Sabulitectum sp.]HPJ27731.1 HPr family phosphocarrier protein [Candidatus Sabulitectum sp.]HPR22361.1 HPr family phosphocarrier protein [Candidatus Sabulitectum sp.]
MTEITVTVPNKLGIHARPAALIVRAAVEYEADIWISNGEERVNAKSIMGVMTLAASGGTQVVVTAEGDDHAEAAEAVAEVIRSGFGEEML